LAVNKLISAAGMGDPPDKIRYLVREKGIDVNVRDENGMSPLIYAAFFGHGDAVKELLACGCPAGRRPREYCQAAGRKRRGYQRC
jgi:ankyrin repeat protein